MIIFFLPGCSAAPASFDSAGELAPGTLGLNKGKQLGGNEELESEFLGI